MLLREDNADLRLAPAAKELGLLDEQQWKLFCQKKQNIENETKRLATIFIYPNTKAAQAFNDSCGEKLEREYKLIELLRRPNVSYAVLMNIINKSSDDVNDYSPPNKVAEQIEIQAKYAGYIAKQADEILRSEKTEHTVIPLDVDYNAIVGLSNEVREKLKITLPTTLGQAGRIPGVTPAAISLLRVSLKKHQSKQ